jgi:hypothetical protein
MIVRKSSFISTEGRRVMIAPAVLVNGRMGNVKHLVKHDILDHRSRDDVRVE